MTCAENCAYPLSLSAGVLGFLCKSFTTDAELAPLDGLTGGCPLEVSGGGGLTALPQSSVLLGNVTVGDIFFQ